MKRPRQNEPCRCGSGKKYKKCHKGFDERNGPLKVALSGGTAEVYDLQVTSSYVTMDAPPLAQWFLSLTGVKTKAAMEPGAGNAQCLDALLHLTIAAEAIVNRLLEPLVPTEEWEVKKGNGGVERDSPARKWARLYKMLGIRDDLERHHEPLKGYMVVVDFRNQLVHFKHGKNVTKTELPLETTFKRGVVTTNFHRPLAPAPLTVQTHETDFEALLDPARAFERYDAFRRLLSPVLDRYKEDRFGIVAALRKALEVGPAEPAPVPESPPPAAEPLFKHPGLEAKAAVLLAPIAHLAFGPANIGAAMTLIYTAIEAFAWLARQEGQEKSGEYFKEWVNTYLLPGSGLACTAEDLWGGRCGMVHTYAAESALSRKGQARPITIASQTQMAMLEDLHRMRAEHRAAQGLSDDDAVVVCIEDLYDHLWVAAIRFDAAIAVDPSLRTRVDARLGKQYAPLPDEVTELYLRVQQQLAERQNAPS